MLTSAPVSIDNARKNGVVEKIEHTWRERQLQRGVLSLATINNLIQDWKDDRFNLLLSEEDLTLILWEVKMNS